MSKNNLKSKEPKTLTLEDGRVLTLKTLKIAPLRRFMVRFDDLTRLEVPDSVAIMDILSDCAAIALQSQMPEETQYLKKPVEERTGEDREAFGEWFEMDDIALINREMGGVSFNDPNQEAEEPDAETPQETKEEVEEVGTTSTSTDSSQN